MTYSTEQIAELFPNIMDISDESLRDKVAAFLDGRLETPSPETLDCYLRERFDQSVIVGQLAALLEDPTPARRDP